MSVVKLDTGFNIELALPIAPFQKRFLAWVIDLLIQLAYIWMISLTVSSLIGDVSWEMNYGWLMVLLFLPIILYHLMMEIMMNGQSPGKKALSLRVITSEGGQPSLSQYITRWAFKAIDFPYWILPGIERGIWPAWLFLFLFSGLTCIIITKTSQRIGDLIAGTVMIDTKNKTSWQDTVFMEVEENYQPLFPQVMQLTDRDINTIKYVLSAANNMMNKYEYVDNVVNKLKTALKIETEMDSIDFLELLLKDYNYLSTK